MKKENPKNGNVFEFGQVMSMLEAMNDGIQMIAEVQNEHSKKFDQIDERFDKMEAKFDKLEAKVDKLQDDMTQVKHDLKRKVDYEEFAQLEKRLLKLEKIVLAK